MNQLKRIRIKKKLTQFELSRRSRVHPSRISQLENNLTTPSTREIVRISQALRMLGEEVFGLDPVMRRLIASGKKKAN
jgi:transcriptional regulator with XRE-family HTH domain